MSQLPALPLSSSQQDVWLHQELLPTTPLYNIGGCLRFDGPLSTDLLGRALREVVAGADALRINLLPGDPFPTQVFVPELEFELKTHDFSDRADPEGAARDWMLTEFTRPFRLHGGRLFEFALIRTSSSRVYLLHKYHHLITDGWGVALVVQRIAGCYAALRSGRPLEDGNFGSYGSLVTSDLAYLASPRCESDRRYWTERLRNPPAPLVGARREVTPSRSRGWKIDRDFYDSLSASCRTSGASVFHLLVAAVVTCIARTRDVNDIVLGVPTLNRRTARDKATVGLYTGLKPARFRFDARQSAAELVLHVRSELSRDYRHYQFPLARMPRGQSAGDHARTGLFDVVLSFEHHDYDAVFDGHVVHMEAAPNGFEQNGLAMFIRDYHQRGDVHVDLNHNLAAFTETEVEGLMASFDSLLHGMHDHPTRALRSHSLLPARERQRLVGTWSLGEAVAERGECLHEWISARARQHPELLAVAGGVGRLTYGELEQRANGLAWRLRAAGVGPETCVGIALGRNPALLVALLAVLKAGGAYVPIDRAYPPERVRWTLRDARIGLVLCEHGDLEWAAAEGVRLVSVDGLEQAEVAPPDHAHSENLAYVIYTSGSTGRPKGVMVSHRSIVNYLAFARAAYDLSEAPGVTPLHSSLGFDATITSLLAPLLSGGCVEVLPGPNGLAALCEALSDRPEFTLVKVTPSHLSVLEEELGRRGTWSRPRVLVLGGEALNDAALKFWHTHAPDTRIFNEYGPTEAAVGCCVFEASRASRGGTIPIGRPIWNTRLYVLDDAMEPVPIGMVGELYIGGVGLARGYVGRPALTAERFVADPFGGEPGTRLYRTGDLVRYCAAGCLEFIGRNDAQVKLRGHRVELGEVETAMRTHPGVRDVAVRLEDADGENPRLIGYVVGVSGEAPAADELKRHARRWLPDVMVPAAWVTLERLPLTVHGKLDRRRLPLEAAVGVAARREEQENGRPRTMLEQELVAIWSQVLGVEQVGIHDNFFDLRGDSILALRIVSRARASGIVILLPAIFRHQTIAELAAVARRTIDQEPMDVPDRAAPDRAPLTPVQHWLVDRQSPAIRHYNQIVELEVAPDLSAGDLETILAALVAHHPALRLRLRKVDETWVQEIAERESGPLLSVVDMTDVPVGAEAAWLDGRLADLHRGIDPGSGPVIRGLLCARAADHPGRLFLAAHHAAIDAVSWQILLDDMDVSFQQLAAGEAVALAPRISFSQWARRLVAHASLPEVAEETDYWLGLEKVDPAVLPIDVDPREGPALSSDGVVELSAGHDLTATILSAATSSYQCRVDELLLAALACAIARLTGRHDVLLDLEGHGRDSPFDDLDLSRTVGWLTNIFPFRMTLPESPRTAAETVGAIKRLLRGVPHGGHGYGLLRFLSPDRELRARLARLPTPHLIFNYLGHVDRGEGHGTWFRALKSLRLSRDGKALRPHLLELDVSVFGDELLMRWTFSRHLHSRSAVEHLARACVEELASLVAARPGDDVHTLTPADFPGARLAQNELDLFLARFR